MTFYQLFDLYCTLMRQHAYIRHDELVQPIRAYAHERGVPASQVLNDLKALYTSI